MIDTSHTPGILEKATPTSLWTKGVNGGAIAVMADPDVETSSDFRKVSMSAPRFREAVANADRMILTWNCHDELLAALKELRAWTEWMEHPDGHDTPEQRGCKCSTAYGVAALVDAAIAKAEGRA